MAASAWRCERSERSRASQTPAISISRSGPAGIAHTTASASISSPSHERHADVPAAELDPADHRAEPQLRRRARRRSAARRRPTRRRPAVPPTARGRRSASPPSAACLRSSASSDVRSGPSHASDSDASSWRRRTPGARAGRAAIPEAGGVEGAPRPDAPTDRSGSTARRSSSERALHALVVGALGLAHPRRLVADVHAVDEPPAHLAGVGDVARLDGQPELVDELA